MEYKNLDGTKFDKKNLERKNYFYFRKNLDGRYLYSNKLNDTKINLRKLDCIDLEGTNLEFLKWSKSEI